jgi:hypothetical protein
LGLRRQKRVPFSLLDKLSLWQYNYPITAGEQGQPISYIS